MSGSESVPEDWGDPTPPVEPQGRRHLFLPRRDGVSIRAAAPTCWNPVEPPPPDCCPEDVCFFFFVAADRDNPSLVAEPEGKDRPLEGLTAKSRVNTPDVSM